MKINTGSERQGPWETVMGPVKFDENGRLIDEKTRAKVQDLLESLVTWTRKLKGMKGDNPSDL
ncbi:MAG: hypothetical protein QXF59_05290 [Candidatus Bathyarchaeia archaeon]